MRRRNPDQRFRNVKSATSEPEDHYEASLWRLRNGTATVVDEDVEYAYEVYSRIMERETLNAWIIADATNDQIQTTLGVPPSAMRAYRHLFFDLEIFRDQLDVLSWIAERQAADDTTAHGIQLLQEGYDQGVERMQWVFGKGKNAMDPIRVQEMLMTDAYHRARASRGSKLSSREAAAANVFANTALKVATGLGDKGPVDGNQLMIKLKFTEQTKPLTAALEQHEEILH